MRLSVIPTHKIVARVERLQAVQERNPPSSTEWQLASDALQPLFREMARRQKSNGGILDWRNWK